MKKFDPRKYQDKQRVQTPAQSGISKVWSWDSKIKEYRCKAYEARKTNYTNGVKKITKAHFETLDEAKMWIYGAPVRITFNSILFDQALSNWIDNEVSHRAKTTQNNYFKMVPHLKFFLGLHLEEINPQKVDEWITYIKKNNKNKYRFTFENELEVLSQIFKYHALNNYGFINPVNSNHKKKVKVKDKPPKDKDLMEADFIKFRDELLKLKNGLILATMATIQYYHAFRVGEVAGLFWEDITFSDDYSKRKIKIIRSVKWIRNKDKETYIEDNFKNSRYLVDNKKEYIIVPEAYQALTNFKEASKATVGLIFNDNGNPLDYRHIQYNYNMAFKNAGLAKYSGTHIMRHGGTRNELEQHGDLTLSQQRLGNTSMETTRIYAQRNVRALDNYTLERYKKIEEKNKKSS